MRAAWRMSAAALILSSGLSAQDASRGASAAFEADARAPQGLAETGLYVAGDFGAIDPRNRPFSPQYPLWSDGATKTRWVYLPPHTAIDAADAGEWDFPVGTRFWKEFSFQGRKVETRLLWKATAVRWITASYVWNADGTDAELAPETGVPGLVEIAPGRRHSIPSAADCTACHGARATGPLGFNALQLSTDRDPNAIHGEPLAPGMVTLKTLVEEGLLRPARADLVAKPPRIPASSPLTRAVLGYFASNCGGCHNRRGEITVEGPSLRHSDLLEDGDGIARNLVGHATKWQVPGLPEGASALVNPDAPEMSAILYRMRSRRPSSQMPPLGTVVRDEAAVEAIARWIEQDLGRSH